MPAFETTVKNEANEINFTVVNEPRHSTFLGRKLWLRFVDSTYLGFPPPRDFMPPPPRGAPPPRLCEFVWNLRSNGAPPFCCWRLNFGGRRSSARTTNSPQFTLCWARAFWHDSGVANSRKPTCRAALMLIDLTSPNSAANTSLICSGVHVFGTCFKNISVIFSTLLDQFTLSLYTHYFSSYLCEPCLCYSGYSRFHVSDAVMIADDYSFGA